MSKMVARQLAAVLYVLVVFASASDLTLSHTASLDSSDQKSAALEKEAQAIADDELKEAAQMSQDPAQSDAFNSKMQVEEEPIMKRYANEATVATQKLKAQVKQIRAEHNAASEDLTARAHRAVMALYHQEVPVSFSYVLFKITSQNN